MSEPKPQSDPNPVGDPKPEADPMPAGDPIPEGDPRPAAPEQEIGDRPGNAGQHPTTPPGVDARKNSGKDSRNSFVQRPARQPINDRNTAGDRGAREPASR